MESPQGTSKLFRSVSRGLCESKPFGPEIQQGFREADKVRLLCNFRRNHGEGEKEMS